MKIGVISDSHDNLPMIRRAVSRLNSEERLEYVFHAGDIISPFAAKEFLSLKYPVFFTFGNNDGERLMLKDILVSSSKGKLLWPKITIELEKYKIALLHGEDESVVEALAKSGIYDVVIYGHWHKVVSRLVNNTLIINPGELCGYLTGKSTLAIVDLETKSAEILEL
ncbi:MAG: metallophosphoesterase [Thermoproteota archaeon]|nr:metallophosphoesterase [Candidatus Brockarchaeota archaeon]MBO3801344.1 metallophosphoesterase [Candidatus Brockarchaeota archaeon]